MKQLPRYQWHLNVDYICVVFTGAWLPLQGCVTEAQRKTDV